MSLHLIKLCVGIESVAHLRAARQGRRQCLCYTRNFPRRAAEVLDGGSLYWVIKGVIQVRQRILRFESVEDPDAGKTCVIHLDRGLVPVAPTPRRPFQGWRYLPAADAPPDGAGDADDAPPAEMAAALRDLGLL